MTISYLPIAFKATGILEMLSRRSHGEDGAEAEEISPDDIIDEILKTLKVP